MCPKLWLKSLPNVKRCSPLGSVGVSRLLLKCPMPCRNVGPEGPQGSGLRLRLRLFEVNLTVGDGDLDATDSAVGAVAIDADGIVKITTDES